MKKKNVLYLLGSGRSGTTLLATILNSTPNILTAGELHQFYTYLHIKSTCSCGKIVYDCNFWETVIKTLNLSDNELLEFEKKQNKEERHKYILSIILGKKASLDYTSSQDKLFNAINKFNNKEWILDSSKYIGRFLLLKQLKTINLKGIYVVRDVRGVIHSFNKQVQTPKSPINSIIYYYLTNFFGQIVCWTNKDVIKVRYEDFIEDPLAVVEKIYSKHINSNNKNKKPQLNNIFEMPHIIGGNRLKNSKRIKISKDLDWKKNISRPKQILYYMLCLPLMLINKYKI